MKTRLFTVALVLFASIASAKQLYTPTSTLKKGIIPLVGSTAGLNGASFRTSLRIEAISDAHGRIVFHPLGQIARDDDPSIPYSFPHVVHPIADYLQFDDIVAAMGQSGLGTLDIIPDPFTGGNFIPTVRARIYNDTPNGTFGTDVPMILPRDYFFDIYSTDDPRSGMVQWSGRAAVPPVAAIYRRNVGFRTLSPVGLIATIMRQNGKQETYRIGTFPGEYSTMMSIEQFVKTFISDRRPANTPPITIDPDDALHFDTQDGRAIMFYTYTDNRTNDPSIVIAPAIETNVLTLPYVP